MNLDESHFLAIQALVADARSDPANVGWYVYRAYALGRGESIDEALRPPPPPRESAGLRLVGETGARGEGERG
jgi:hypothetical protein